MKKSLADKIEQYIKVLIERSEEKQIEIQRAELAETFSCVPSQVTYVLSTRFTESEGYFTESRRGGKGFVRITRFHSGQEMLLSLTDLLAFIEKLFARDFISADEKEMLKHVAQHAFNDMDIEERCRIYQAVKNALSDYIKLTRRGLK
ncbi:CtsR family transcriptional regulator [Syntrophomonas erecta]